MVETEGERRAGSVPKFGDPVSIDTTCTENEAKLLTATATSSTDVTSINDNNNNKVLKENDDETPKTFPQIVSRFRMPGQVLMVFNIFYFYLCVLTILILYVLTYENNTTLK